MTRLHLPYDESVNERVNEESVIYQNPLLYLKVWEVQFNESHAQPRTHRPWHYHKEVEFLAVTSGRLGVQTRDDYHLLNVGDVLLVGSSQLHRTHKAVEDPVHFTVLQVDLLQHFDQSSMPYVHSFSELTHPLEKLNYIYRENPDVQRTTFDLIQEIYEESQEKRRGYELAVSAAIRKLMWLLLRHDTRGILPEAETSDLLRLRPVLDYIEENLHLPITVKEVCRLMNFSYHYFIRYFRKATGWNFVEYVNYKRIKKAERLLLTSELDVTEIAFRCGFSSMSQFYKQFKRYNVYSPGKLKQKMGVHNPSANTAAHTAI